MPFTFIPDTISITGHLWIYTTGEYNTLELSDVVALFNNDSLSLNWTGTDIPSKIEHDFTAALWNASEMVVGWIPTQPNHMTSNNCMNYIKYCKSPLIVNNQC